MLKRLSVLLAIIVFICMCASCTDTRPGKNTTEPGNNNVDTGVTDNGKDNDKDNDADNGNEPVPGDTPEPGNALVSPDNPETDNTPEPTQPTAEAALRLYLKYIDELRNDSDWNDYYATMSLVFIDDDDIPELVIDRSYPLNGIIICTVINGKVETVLAEGGGGGISYIERGNIFTYIANIRDVYYDVISCIEDGGFAILHKGSRNVSGNKCAWDGEAVSFTEYYKRYEKAFNLLKSEYSGMNAVRTADLIYDINVLLGEISSNAAYVARDPKTGLLTSDGAYAVYKSWQDDHPDTPDISRQSEAYEYNGEMYYHFPARSIFAYYYSILVNMETGALLHLETSDGMYAYELIEPLDNWYCRLNPGPDDAPYIDIIDYDLPYEQNVGDSFIVTGLIDSNRKILSVSVTVFNDDGEAETGSIAYPLTYTYNLNNLDNDILFDKLTPGGKKYVIEATNEYGTITMTYWFLVYQE